MTIEGCFDTIHGTGLYGWALDTDNPDEPVMVEALTAGGEILGTAKAGQFRGDLLAAGKGSGNCAFRIEIARHITSLVGVRVGVRPVGHEGFFTGFPQTFTLNPNFQYLFARPERAKSTLHKLRTRLNREARQGGISIVMPIHNTRQEWLIEALESVRNQWCDRWELICVDDASTQPHVGRILRAYARAEPRIRVMRTGRNGGIARATNFGLRAARYDYVAFMDHDDYLEPHAIWSLIRAAQKSAADLIYSDEVITSESISDILDIRARPAFSYDYYLSHPYFVHMVCVRRDVAYSVQGWNEDMAISADVDFVLRVIEKARAVAHVPSVLYRWRTHATSAGHMQKQGVTVATTASIQAHLDRVDAHAIAAPGVAFNQFRVSWPVPDGRTLIVVPTKNGVDLLRLCVRSIESTVDPARYRLVVIDHQSTEPPTRRFLQGTVAKRHTVMPYAGPFNFSRMNNEAVARHGEGFDFILFMNNDVQAQMPAWLDRLASLVARRDVGIAGPALLFGDRRIQHAGVIIGYDGAAEHVGKSETFEDAAGERRLGANFTLTSVRDFSAVTAACLMVRRSVFQEAGGFNEALPVAFNDTDLCLRVRGLGYRVLYDGQTWLYHHESATRKHTNDLVHPADTRLFQDTWKHLMRGHDPFYNPALSLTVQDHVLNTELVVAPAAPRVVSLRRHEFA